MGKPRQTFASICLSGCISWCIAWAVLGLSPSHARAEADEAGRACNQSITRPDDTIASCSALIDSGSVSGRQLAAAYAQRGFARTLKRRLTEAETDLDQAIRIDPDYAEAYANRANFWTVSKKPDRAMTDAEAAVRLNPALPIAYFVRAGAAMNLGQYDRAIADYTQTIRLRPGGSADVYAARGYVFHRKGDEAHAIEDYSEKLKAAPDDVGTLLNRGDALRNMHEMSRAIADYDAAIRIDPSYATAYYNRGNSRLETGDKDGAVADYRQAAKLNPSLKQATERLQQVETKL